VRFCRVVVCRGSSFATTTRERIRSAGTSTRAAGWSAVGILAGVDRSDLDAYLDRVLIGDREPGPVVLVDSDASWPARFERERARIRDALGGLARRVEHIGSTSVPGLAAKPIVDILVTIADADDETAVVARLERAGYVLRVRESGHRMFRTPDLAVHVHVWSDSDPETERYLTFRDRLRSSSEDRKAYESLKRELARRDWDEIGHYADAKGPLIEAILVRARCADW
jgi:GrpB-like predicted nucleotidyltransferase (UPF0157 family)